MVVLFYAQDNKETICDSYEVTQTEAELFFFSGPRTKM